jgi:alkanesulfonate monooxygenase SsuD/methylene tetrahydromethanopterin reductase-like flavin-dependent oxidoreductase (luciferase family)
VSGRGPDRTYRHDGCHRYEYANRDGSAAGVLCRAPSPHLIGRETELDLLDQVARRVTTGVGSVVCVVGEPGIGKTSLLGAARDRLPPWGSTDVERPVPAVREKRADVVSPPVRVGVLLMPTDPWATTVERVRRLEAMGYDHLWVYDHLSWRRYRDRAWHGTYPWLTGLAALTSRIRLGTMVANPNIRHPLVLAKDAMTLDHISAGRFTLGLGAGGTGFDSTVMGQAPLDPGDRIDRLEEFAAVLDGLLRGELTDHVGRWYRIEGGRLLPGCIQVPRVPLAIAAGGRRGLRLVAGTADAWITYGDTSHRDLSAEGTEAIVARQRDILDESCSAIGREPSSIDRIYLIGNTAERPLASCQAFIDFAGRYRDLGFTDIVFHHPRPDDPVWDEPEEIVEAIATTLLT